MTLKRTRYRGSLLGLAAGDAVGTTVEFMKPGTFAPVNDMKGGGPFKLAPGQWTDDTSMALCLAESLITCRGFSARDQMRRYVSWWRAGHLSSTGRCFDIGNTVRAALSRFEKDDIVFAGATDPQTAGNGSLMRLTPVVLAFADRPELAIELAATSSRTTHGAEVAVDACRYFAALILGALEGKSKEALLSPLYSPVAGYWERAPLCQVIADIASGSFLTKEPPAIKGTGYAAHSIEAALWAFARSESFEEGCLKAVNLGDDADTTAAVYGQIAGAFYGVDGIPARWLELLAMRADLETFADDLLALSKSGEAKEDAEV